MKLRLATTLLLVVGLAVAATTVSVTTTTRSAKAATGTTWPISTYGTPRLTDNVILKWDEQLLSTIRAYPAATGPTITSRALGVLHTAGILGRRRDGNRVLYSIADATVFELCETVCGGLRRRVDELDAMLASPGR